MYLASETLLLLAILPTAALSTSKAPAKNAILLSRVKSLTLHAGHKTTARRTSAIPQLTCQGRACKHHTVETMRCTNMGSSYSAEDIEWSCTASLPEEFKLGATEVMCEGFRSPEDEFVLKGSCGVDYRLLYTEKGEERYGSPGWRGGEGGKKEGGADSVVGALFMLLFVGVAAWILWSFVKSWMAGPRGQRGPDHPAGGGGGFDGGGWGGGGWGDPHDPPPPYPGKGSDSAAGGPQAHQNGWRPGFWTGALAGSTAGYLAGNRGGRGTQRNSASEPFTTSPAGSSRANSSGSSSSSSARHQSTGFGSTSRR